MATSIFTGAAHEGASLAGAATFDATMQRIGSVSAESFDRDGTEDYAGMVAVLDKALRTAMDQSPEFRFGFLLPLVELIDCRRLANEGEASKWSGTQVLQAAARKSTTDGLASAEVLHV